MNEYESVCFCPTEWVGLFYVLFYDLGLRSFFFLFAQIWGFVSLRGGRYIFIFIYTEKLTWAIMAGRFSLFFSILILLILFFFDIIVLYLSVFLFWLLLLLCCWVSISGQLRLFTLQVSLSSPYPIIYYIRSKFHFSPSFFSRFFTLHKTLHFFGCHILFTILIYLNLSFFSPLFTLELYH